MKILMIDPIPKKNYRISKDTSGGYGTGNDFGDSLIPRTLKKLLINNSKWPALFAAYSFAVIKNHGFDITYVKNFSSDINKFEFIIIVSSIVSHETELEIIKKIKNVNKNIPVVAIGPFATSNYKKYNDALCNVIIGEPEFFFLDKNNIFKIKSSNEISNFSDNKNNNNLDHLPYPNFEEMGYDLKKINNLFGKNKSIPMIATRGCPYSCFNYCVYPLQQGRKVRQRDIQEIIKEIKYWVDEKNIQMIIFRDPVFSINKKHTIDLCQKIIEEKIKIKFVIETHLRILDEDLIKILKKAGLVGVKVGVESYSKDILKNAKRFTVEKDEQIEKIRLLESYNISVSSMFILGFPTDTEKSIIDTINYAKKLNTTYAQFSVWTPYPGTPIFNEYKDKIIVNEYEKFDQYRLVYKHNTFNPNQIRNFMDMAYTKYYGRFIWFFKYIYSYILKSS